MTFSWRPKNIVEQEKLQTKEGELWANQQTNDNSFQWQPSKVTGLGNSQWQPKLLGEQNELQSQTWITTLPQTGKATFTWHPKSVLVGEKAEQTEDLPWWKDILHGVGTGFEWISEHLEKPFAAIITSPWSPSLTWKTGESWLDHQKREYEAWAAPKFVKGLAEFAMPLYWLPYFGWAGKGAKALGATNKMARALESAGKFAEKIHLPSSEVLDTTLFKKDFFKTVSLWAENKPVLNSITRIIGGPSAFVKAPALEETALDITKRALIKKSVIYDMRNGARGLLMPKLQAISSDPVKLLDIAPDGLVKGATALDGSSTYLSDLIEGFVKNPDNYKFANPEGKKYVQQLIKTVNQITDVAKLEGVKVSEDFTFHRMVKGVQTELKGDYELSDFGSKFDMARHRTTMMDGALGTGGKRIVLYENNPATVVSGTIDHYMRAIATKRFDNEVGQLGKTAAGLFSEQFPDEAQKIADLASRLSDSRYISESINGIITKTPGWGSKLAKIRRGTMSESENIANSIEAVFSFAPKETDKMLSAMGSEFWQAAKIKPKEFKIALAQFNKTPGRILMGELDDAVHSLNVSKKIATTAIENAYKESCRTLTSVQKDLFKTIKTQVDNILETTKTELKPLKAAKTEFIRPYREGKQILGTNLKVFTSHPAFRNMIFPKEVVELAETALKTQGNAWLKTMSEVSGVGRTLVAAMDFSAPFIQGLAVLGRNPLAWAKGVLRQFEFFLKPGNFAKYMADPATMATRAERIAFGGSSQTFEYMEAVPQISKFLGKTITGQTYGRAEAAFTGFGEVARNEMWKSLRNKAVINGKVDEGIARELARTIDRMTGVMSTEALGMSRSAREFENAFVFFAPRYTRASLSYVADIFKGGITGAEARKSLSGLMAGGSAMYYGTCKVLDQTPNFDITSPNFMTIKIGNENVGVGGAFYGIARLTAGVIGTAVNQPVDLVRLNRFDNPFIKFMFSRTSPLTGTIVNAIEQKDYLGRPFESVADWGRFMADKILPIAAQSFIEPTPGGGRPSPLVGVANVFGARTFPQSAWQLQEAAKDKLAQETYYLPYTQLNDLQKRDINNRPEVTLFQEEIDKRTTQIGKALSVAFLDRQRERDDARFMYIQQLNQLQDAYDAGVINGTDFKDELQMAKYGYGQTLEHIDRNPRYADALKKLQQPKDISQDFVGDLAYDELQSASYTGQFEDKYGMFDYDAYNKFRDYIRQKYGEVVWNYLMQREAQTKSDLPPLAQEYEKAKEILKPYWNITEQVKRMGIDPESKFGQRLVTRMRKQLKLSNPLVAKYLTLFYGYQS
jgi:hypothetical protein